MRVPIFTGALGSTEIDSNKKITKAPDMDRGIEITAVITRAMVKYWYK